MTLTQEQIERLRTLQESLDWAINLAENQLPELNTALQEIKDKVNNIQLPEIDTTNIASKDLERFFGVKPIDGYEFMSEEEVYQMLEEIMTTMDGDLTAEMATNITEETQTIIY